MIKHIVLCKIKEEYLKDLLSTKALILSMADIVKEIKAIQVGIDFLHSERSYDLVLEILLESETDLNSYQVNEYHAGTVKKLLNKISEKMVAIDYYLDE